MIDPSWCALIVWNTKHGSLSNHRVVSDVAARSSTPSRHWRPRSNRYGRPGSSAANTTARSENNADCSVIAKRWTVDGAGSAIGTVSGVGGVEPGAPNPVDQPAQRIEITHRLVRVVRRTQEGERRTQIVHALAADLHGLA